MARFIWIVCLLVTAGASAQPLTVLPPRVIDCNPKQFATSVSANLNQITLTFDRPMNTQSRGGLGGVRFAGVNPLPREVQPSWDATGTVLVLPVRLEPDVTYALAINESKNRGLVDVNGVAAVGFFYVFSTGERSLADFAPHVVKTEPELGAQDVDPALRQITVTFSRPVAPGDFSWVLYRGSGEHPAAQGGGSPQLAADRMTATLDVRLSPGIVYAIGINDPAYLGYKDTRGWPVLPYGLCFKTR